MLVLLAFTAEFLFAGGSSCPGKNLVQIERPIGNTGKSFTYHYESFCRDAKLPTIIHIPGGPRETSIGDSTFNRMKVNIIRTDPRGTGSNLNFWDRGGTDKDLSTESVADDIVSLIENEKLTNYSIHGVSFGSAVATVVASKLEKKRSKYLPKSVILEGVVGRAMKEDEQFLSTRKLFEEIKSEAKFCVTCKLDELKPHLSKIEIGNLVDAIQGHGKTAAIQTLKEMPPKDMISASKASAAALAAVDKRFYHAIACREFTKDGIVDTIYQNGELKNSSVGSCPTKNLSQPFDSAAWPSSVMTYYVVGGSDPMTPPAMAKYHFDSQKNSKNKVICVRGGGHSPLDSNIGKCSIDLVSKMHSNSSLTAGDFSACESPVKLDTFECTD